MVSIETFTFNAFEENTYVVFDEGGEAAIIDPGCSNRAEENELVSFIRDRQLSVRFLLNTHCHVDHVLGNSFVKNTFQVPLLIHAFDEPVLRSVKIYAPMYGFHSYHEVLPDGYLKEGDELTIGRHSWRVMFLPGHAPGHVGFYQSESGLLVAGDVLFQGSVGRTDLPGGSFDVLMESIQTRVFALPDSVVVYPGHGPATTVGEEKVSNPFCGLAAKR